MNLTLETGVSAITVFLQGLVSFFSPCVLPLIPLYIGYLSGGAKTENEDGTVVYKRSRVIGNTFFFVIGISFAFFLLGFGFTTAGKFFHNYQTLFTRIGGIIVVLFGLYQLGLFGQNLFYKEHRIHFRPDTLAMNPLTALIMGFTFSFAWTPCVGPALASVLLLSASAASSFMGFALIGVYTLGFVLPFMAVGLFTKTLLDLFKKYRSVVKYTVKIGGVLMILIGVMMFTGWMNGISSYLSGSGTAVQNDSPSASAKGGENSSDSQSRGEDNLSDTSDGGSDDASKSGDGKESPDSSGEETARKVPAPDFSLTDQYGNPHTLSDYKGKTIFLNFWATWCPPCKGEMPEIQEIYEDYGENGSDVIVLGIASPDYGREADEESVAAFLEENGYSFPVVMDTGGFYAYTYGVSAYPTTFMIDKEGNVFGYVTGQLTKEIMESIIEQTKNSIP
ncbi:MAG: redoxin family protein [Lachnospiraceae bacterium]|nr:redoxin family protein [Lachnospiraceae bacterium]